MSVLSESIGHIKNNLLCLIALLTSVLANNLQ